MTIYKKFLIKQQTYSGSNYTDLGSGIDTQEKFKVVCQEFPFKYLPEPKEMPKRDWYDESGEDVYVPSEGVKFKSYDLEATFIYVGTTETIKADLRNFIDFLYGRIDENGNAQEKGVMLAIYDEYTQTGRRGVCVVNVDNTLYWDVDYDIDSIATFKIKFRVTDPVTRINSNLRVEV